MGQNVGWHGLFGFLADWRDIYDRQRRAREQYPDGGKCHVCGKATGPGITECEGCHDALQW